MAQGKGKKECPQQFIFHKEGGGKKGLGEGK